jgi:hypothetical protein
LFLSTIFTSEDTASKWVGLLFFVIFFVFIIGSWKLLQKSSKKNAIRQQESLNKTNNIQLQWEQAMSRWVKLYYCGRDDVVFIPGEKTSSNVAEMFKYLYSFPGKK